MFADEGTGESKASPSKLPFVSSPRAGADTNDILNLSHLSFYDSRALPLYSPPVGPNDSALSHPYFSFVPSPKPEEDGPTFFLPRKARVAMSSLVCLPSAFLVAPCDDTAPAALRSSYNRERSQSAMFSLRRCVLCLPSQKARPIFTYHFDTISGCNGN